MANCVKTLVTKPNGLSSIFSLQGPPCRRELTLTRYPFTSTCHCCMHTKEHTYTYYKMLKTRWGAVYGDYPSLASYYSDKD